MESLPDESTFAMAVAKMNVTNPLRAGQLHETTQLCSTSQGQNPDVWRPTQTDMDSAAFKVIVGEAKFMKGGLPRGTIFDSVDGGLLEIKGGSSVLSSSYQLTTPEVGSYRVTDFM
ncbi:MAG: hypothetical protein EOP49_54060, partial [Sphingobacteriales bacterium]